MTIQHVVLLKHFNPRFPWGKRLFLRGSSFLPEEFQSTLPVGEATNGMFI